MIEQIQDLVRFYAQKYHVPLSLFTDSWQIESWDRNGIAIVLPSDVDNARAITKLLPGDLVVIGDIPVSGCILMPAWVWKPLMFTRSTTLLTKPR